MCTACFSERLNSHTTYRFLDEYDLTLPNGPDKYKKAAEFLMNAVILGSNGILQRAFKARKDSDGCAAEAEVAEVSSN